MPSYDDLMLLVKNPNAIRAIWNLIKRLFDLSDQDLPWPLPTSSSDRYKGIRVYVSAYLVVLHPRRVFDYNRPSEMTLTNAAIRMLSSVSAMVDSIKQTRSIPRTHAHLFKVVLKEYADSFMHWKTSDVEMLEARLKRSLCVYYKCDSLMPADYESPQRTVYREEISKLRTKLSRTCGEQALRDFDSTRVDAGYVKSYEFNVYNTMALHPSDEALQYELLIDPNFRVPEHDCSSLGISPAKITNTFEMVSHNAFAPVLSLIANQTLRSVKSTCSV
jgi:hypothetical protein